MKVWIKNKRYKIKSRKDGCFDVYGGDRVIAMVLNEENARQAIWIAIGGKEYVDEKDFKVVEDEN